MIFRFSLYGFLKNQRYFEPFLILLLRQQGLGFLQIGILISFREIIINLVEIPSGAVADVLGRKKSMLFSFCVYLVSFIVFANASSLVFFFIAMFFYALGDAFRTGTHKAIIFDWLKSQGREGDRHKVYGFTRSWSKIGSAISILIAGILVYFTSDYSIIFYASCVPYVFSILNISSYPSFLDGEKTYTGLKAIRQIFKQTIHTIFSGIRQRDFRQLLIEAMGFEGIYLFAKDYLQPILNIAAISFFAAHFRNDLTTEQQTVIFVIPVYFLLHFLSAIASRNSHIIVERFHSEFRGAQILWFTFLTIQASLFVSAFFSLHYLLIATFVVFALIQNIWRPFLISRFNAVGEVKNTATVLSVESQFRRLTAIVFAPLIGFFVDHYAGQEDVVSFYSIGILGLVVGSLITFLYYRNIKNIKKT